MLRSVSERVAHILAFNVLLVWTASLSAQSLAVAGEDEALVRAAIQKYSRNYDSQESALEIPVHTWYHLAYKEVLNDPALQSGFTADDLVLLVNLPAHTDHSFIIKDQLELGAVCAAISHESLTDSTIMSIAGDFDLSRMRRDKTLDDHYLQVTAALSVQGQSTIATLIDEFRLTKNISWSTFDLGGFAAEFPGAAKNILRNGCTVFYSQISAYTPQTIKLIDHR